MQRIYRLFGAFTVVFASALSLAGSASAQERTRAIVLSFEGWRSEQARRAAVSGLETQYELITEDQAVQAATEIGVDVSTPEGMSSVVDHLHITLVIGGFVEGTGRRATTTVWIMDSHGNELTRRTTDGPQGRGAARAIGAAALEAAAEGMAVLARQAETARPQEVEPEPEPERDIYDERPPDSLIREDEDTGPRWIQPLFRGFIGLDLRNRVASVSPGAALDRFDADFFPMLQVLLETRPFAQSRGFERGLYASLSAGFSVGLSYFTRNGQQRAMNAYDFDFAVGYGIVIAELFELIPSVGIGLDGIGLEANDPLNPADFPSVQLTYFRPAVAGRIRAYEDWLAIELGIGGRIAFDLGDIGSSTRPGTYGLGGASGGGVDLFLGASGIVDPGFSWMVRFGYAGHFLGFTGGPKESGVDEGFHIDLFVGWAIR